MYLGCPTLILGRTLFSLFFSLVFSRIAQNREKECVSESIHSRVAVLMRLRGRMIGSASTFCSSLLLCNNNTAFLRSRRSSKRGAMLFPIASKSSSTTGGEFSSIVFHGRRRFRGQEERRFGGGLCKENTTKYNTTTHLQKRDGFVLASTNGIQNNEQLKLFSVSSSLL